MLHWHATRASADESRLCRRGRAGARGTRWRGGRPGDTPPDAWCRGRSRRPRRCRAWRKRATSRRSRRPGTNLDHGIGGADDAALMDGTHVPCGDVPEIGNAIVVLGIGRLMDAGARDDLSQAPAFHLRRSRNSPSVMPTCTARMEGPPNPPLPTTAILSPGPFVRKAARTAGG